MNKQIRKMSSNNLLRTIILTLSILVSIHASGQKTKVACVGNSITAGLGIWGNGYPEQMQGLLGTTNWEIGNFGDSARLLQKLGYSYWDSGQYTNALNSSPDVVVIGLGTNDAYNWALDGRSANFKADYKALIQSFQDLSSTPEVYICLIAPAENNDWGLYNSYINQVNVYVKEVALEKGVGLIDLNSVFDGHWPEWFQDDAVHPSATGAGEIAQEVKDMLLRTKPTITSANGMVTAPDGFDYQWYIDGTPIDASNGGNQKEMAVTQSGTYKVSIKLNMDNETRIVSEEMTLTGTLSVNAITTESGMKIYPNPVSDVISISINGSLQENNYMIIDLSGKIVISGQLLKSQEYINIRSLPSGTYILVIDEERIKIIKR